MYANFVMTGIVLIRVADHRRRLRGRVLCAKRLRDDCGVPFDELDRWRWSHGLVLDMCSALSCAGMFDVSLDDLWQETAHLDCSTVQGYG